MTSNALTSSMYNQSYGQQSRNVMIDSQRLNAHIESQADGEIYVEADMIQALQSIDGNNAERQSILSRSTNAGSTNTARRLLDSNAPGKQLEPIQEQDDEGMLDHNNENDQDAAMDYKEQAENMNKFVLKNLNLKQNKSKDQKHS